MKILYVTPKPPIPIEDGGCYAMAQLMRSLADLGTLSLVTIETHKHPYDEQSEQIMHKIDKDISVIHLNTKFNVLKAGFAYLKKRNYNLSRFTSPYFQRTLLKRIKTVQPDLIVLDSLYTAVEIIAIKKISKAKIVVRVHNVESDLWTQHAASSKGIKGKYVSQLARSLIIEEKQLLSHADLIWTISKSDQAVFQSWFPEKKIDLLPVAVEKSNLTVTYNTNSCFHIGSMNWRPNIEAVDFLIDEVWSKAKDLPKLILAGTHIDSYQKKLPKKVVIAGKVPHVGMFMASNGILVSPIRSGSGIRIKILEALACGVPVITTALGAEGIDCDESGIHLADGSEEFIRLIRLLSGSEELRRESGLKGIEYIEKFHSFTRSNECIKNGISG